MIILQNLLKSTGPFFDVKISFKISNEYSSLIMIIILGKTLIQLNCYFIFK